MALENAVTPSTAGIPEATRKLGVLPGQASAFPDARTWYGVAQSDGPTFGTPLPLADLDSSTLADLIRIAADELARRGYWTRGK